MKKLTLSPIQVSQLRAFLRTFGENEPIPLYPNSRLESFSLAWDVFLQCGLTPAVFRKSLNTLAERGLGEFEAGSGSVFKLNEKGRSWLDGGFNE